MPSGTFGKDITRGTICRDRFRAEVTVVCSDQLPQGQPSHLLVSVRSRPAGGKAEVVLAFRPLASPAHGDIRFDQADGPTSKTFNGDVGELLVIHGKSASAGNTPDVVLDVKIDGEVRGSIPLSVRPAGSITPAVEIRAENGVDPAQDLILLGGSARFKAAVTPATAGTFRWFSVRPDALEIKGSAEKESVEVAGRRPATPLPAADPRVGLGVLFTPTAGPAVFAVHRIWPAIDPDQRGPFRVGRTDYTTPSFTIPGSLENWPSPIEVTVEALVRYPAQRDGVNEPFSTQRPKYPLVILAHGRHNAIEFERNPDGSIKPNAFGHRVPIRTVAGDLAEFHSYEGLEYLASHLASYGFVAVSINLNGKFDPVTGKGELVEPAMDVVSCRPFKADQAAIAHRGLTVLKHIKVMEDKNGSDPLFMGKVDMDKVGLIGHSRGGEAVVSAYDINNSALVPPPDRAHIKAVFSIAPTDFRGISTDVPYAVVLGSDDEDVSDGGGLRLYDRAKPPKQMVWVIGAIHNYFSSNWHWQDEVPADPPVTRPQHEDIAKGYSNVFLQSHLYEIAGADAYFTGNIGLTSVSSVELHHAYQTPGGLVVDQFEDVPTDKTKNALNEGVTAPTAKSFDEVVLHRLTAAPPFALSGADVPDLIAGTKDIMGCMVNRRSWYHDTNGLLVEWDSVTAKYTTLLPGSSVAGFDVLSFRVAQDVAINPAGGRQDYRVRLADSAGQQAALKVSDFATIPFPRKKELTLGALHIDVTKSVFKTVRLPLSRFKLANPSLNLGSLASITLEFGEKVPGMLGFDDLEFSK